MLSWFPTGQSVGLHLKFWIKGEEAPHFQCSNDKHADHFLDDNTADMSDHLFLHMQNVFAL